MNEIHTWIFLGIFVFLAIVYVAILVWYFLSILKQKLKEKELKKYDRIYQLEKELFKLKHKDNPLFDEYVVTVLCSPWNDQTVEIQNQYDYGYKQSIEINKRIIPALIRELLKYK